MDEKITKLDGLVEKVNENLNPKKPKRKKDPH